MPSIFITGAAQGIGRTTADLFWSRGWFVGAVDVDDAAVRQWADDKGERAFAAALDVTDTARWPAVLAEFQAAANGTIDVLLNNAGILADGPFAEIPLAKQHTIVDVNVKGVMNGCYFAKPMLETGARVINLCSASALYGAPSVATYSASKFAVRALTEALRIEWAADGITVCDLMPIFVRTAMVDNMTKVQATIKLGVHITPEQVANTILRAATDKRPSIHYPVGSQTHQMKFAGRFMPDWVMSAITRKLSGF
ncbi:MAG: SDR family oxidoreductase [Oceanococcaceae bacterium]